MKELSHEELVKIQKPAQYLGGEKGSISKVGQTIDLHVCLAFPDVYEVGMSHIGLQILYDLINKDPKMWAERVYVPWPDMEKLLRARSTPLRSLESKRPLAEFDLIGFSMQYELCMTGILTILDLGGVPLLQKDRREKDPLIIGGGPVCYHPEPFADFFDCFLVGDGEELVPEFLAMLRDAKEAGLSRAKILERAAKIEGIYVPSFFEALYEAAESEALRFTGFKPLLPGYTSVRRRVIATLEGASYPTKPIVPNVKPVHDRLSVEVMRGCVRGCRFCQAGYLYRPQRERKPEEILDIVKKSLDQSGFEELSLLSLSTADYCSILPLLSSLKERFAKNDDLAITFPSTRVDALKPELLQEVQPIRRSGFTIAPEAGTQRLRDVINKGVTDEELMQTCQNVFGLGWNSVKLYFMIGLPTETDQDLYGIIETARRVKGIAGRNRDVTVSVSTLVPKPHTPFQWAEQIGEEETLRRQRLLAYELKRSRITFRYHEPRSSVLEGVFARGDRRLGSAILRAYQLGCRLEAWSEHLREDLWLQAFSECGIDPLSYLKERSIGQALPWDHISCDIDKAYFKKEWERALALRTTPDCLTETCSNCGACDYDAMRNVLFDRKRTESRLQIVNPAWDPIIAARENGQPIEIGRRGKITAPLDTELQHEPSGSYNLVEYLKTEVDSKIPRRRRGALEEKQRLRLRYSKKSVASYVGHLELASIFFRACRRAKLPLSFTKGFNPGPRLSFGPPLQLGLESSQEYVDLFLTASITPEILITSLNSELPEGVRALECSEVPLNGKSIQATIRKQSYAVSFLDPKDAKPLLDSWRACTLNRERGRSSKTVSLAEYVTEVAENGTGLNFTLSYANGGSLKPSEVVEALFGASAEISQISKVGVEFS